VSQLPFVHPEFERIALALFRYQAAHNPVYAEWVRLQGWDSSRIEAVSSLDEVPFLPIEAFKTREVRTGTWEPEATFTSSGTTGQTPSRHDVARLEAYLRNAEAGFAYFYGAPSNYAWLCLLPSYLEREGSSLVAMAQHFVQQSPAGESGFFLKGLDELRFRLETLEANGVPTVILGVTFALLDWAESLPKPMPLKHSIIMETGGMKGRRVEPSRAEVHQTLQHAFGLDRIHSEYGMTELLSQAYSQGEGRFRCPPSMRVIPRDLEAPRLQAPLESRCGINIVDLANADSCAFIATEDAGRVFADGSFEVLGRLEGAELRGCSLMAL
jgi:phenylacetate-coenzyme A ligase PaaK-like adenylate-forming protein